MLAITGSRFGATRRMARSQSTERLCLIDLTPPARAAL